LDAEVAAKSDWQGSTAAECVGTLWNRCFTGSEFSVIITH